MSVRPNIRPITNTYGGAITNTYRGAAQNTYQPGNSGNLRVTPEQVAKAAEAGGFAATVGGLIQSGKAGLARLAGGGVLGKVAAGVGGAGAGALAAKGALAVAAAHAATGSIGGTINAANRMMNGENPVQAVGNAVFDTADYLTLGATRGLSDSVQKMIGLEGTDTRAEDLNKAKEKLETAVAAGDYGGAALAEQELKKLAAQTGVQAPGQSDQELYEERMRLALQQSQLRDDQTFNNYKRITEYDSQKMNENANKALDRSWYAQNWQTNNSMNQNASSALNSMMTNSVNNVAQAAMMKW